MVPMLVFVAIFAATCVGVPLYLWAQISRLDRAHDAELARIRAISRGKPTIER